MAFVIALSITGVASAQTPEAELPVSLDRIRSALAQPAGTLQIETDHTADFTVHVRERAPLEEIVPSLDFRSGPVPPGGLYAFEQRQRLGQPYAEQPLIQIDVLPFAHVVVDAIRHARHAAAERAAREQVRRELAAFCVEHGCR